MEKQLATDSLTTRTATLSVGERLERSEVVFYPESPFPLPTPDDLRFLLEQKLARGSHKNISYNPGRNRADGFRRDSRFQAERLRAILAQFSQTVTTWLAAEVPNYAPGWRLDRVSLRTEEEATRRLRQTARNDLLHVDSFPTRPTNGWRILRLFVNINPTEPRIWTTSEPFSRLLDRYGRDVGLPTSSIPSWNVRATDALLRFFNPNRPRPSVYDCFMSRFHDFLKGNDVFQEHCAKRYWTFPSGSVWLALTDTVSHAVLRGRGALEHSYFVSPDTLLLPAASPVACLQRACGRPVLNVA